MIAHSNTQTKKQVLNKNSAIDN